MDVWQLHEFGGIEAPGFFRKCGNLVVSEGGIGRFGKGVIHRIFLWNVSFISSNLNTGKKLNIHHSIFSNSSKLNNRKQENCVNTN